MSYGKHPLEFYGRFVSPDTIGELASLFESQECPLLGRRCLKQRKSDPQQTIGACLVGHQDKALIICPHRFLQRNQIFLDSVRLLQPGLRYRIVPEIAMPGGQVDYFLVGLDGDTIVDYVGIEIQALDTVGTGGIWDARVDVASGSLAEQYAYGVNWKMSAKTILVQMHHKISSFEALDKRLVLVIQREFYDYISEEFRTEQIRAADDTDSLHIHIYDVVMFNSSSRASGLHIVLDERLSTNQRGVESMLNLGRSSGISEEEVIERIRIKLPRSRPLDLA